MENFVIHKAASRGYADHLWMQAKYTFSFANYHNPHRMGFGVLRVLNDDVISPGKGFEAHPHENMEIVTIPLEGALQHSDNLGNSSIIGDSDIQVLSAGSGIMHRESNASKKEFVKLLQIWIYPNKRNVRPRYQQMKLQEEEMKNKMLQVLSPDSSDNALTIYQDTWFYLGSFTRELTFGYQLKKTGNGIYIFIIIGSATVNGEVLEKRDGYGIWDIERLWITVSPNTEILLMEVPMTTKNWLGF